MLGLRLDGSNSAYPVFSGVSSKVEGMAVDWYSGNIYWTDSLYNWIALAPGTPNNKWSRIIISTGLDKPMGLCTYPKMG